MKTFEQFISITEGISERINKMSDAEFDNFMKGRHPAEAETFRRNRISTNPASRTSAPPPPSGANASASSTGTASGTRPPRPYRGVPESPSARFQTVQPPATAPAAPGRFARAANIGGRALNVAGVAVPAYYDYKGRREAGQSQARAAGGAAATAAGTQAGWMGGMATGARLGMAVPSWNPYVKGAATLALGTAGAILGGEGTSRAYDWAVDKSRPIRQGISQGTGYKSAQDLDNLTKQIQVRGGAKPTDLILPGDKRGLSGGKVDYGTARRQAASTLGNRSSREIAAASGRYGSRQGSALTGLGGPMGVDYQNRAILTKGKVANLASTQLVRDPKSGKQVVGDLAYKNGAPVYLARASVPSRDMNIARNLSRWTGIGGQRQADAQAARGEYRTALRNTQQYTRQLGITPQAATNQKLPGYGVGPKKVGAKKVGPKIVGPKKVGPKPVQGPASSLVRPA